MIDYSEDGMLAQLLRNLWDAANNGNQDQWDELLRQGEGALASLLESFDSIIYEHGVSDAEARMILVMEEIDSGGPISRWTRWSQLRVLRASVSAAARRPLSALGLAS